MASSANFGINLGIPIQPNGMKVELMIDHQSTDFTNGNGGGLFDPSHRLGNFDITYYHAGILVPFNQSYAATPYFIGSAGVATLDPRRSDVSTATRFSASAGIGVKVPIQSHAGIRGEIRGSTPRSRTTRPAGCATTRTTAICSRARRTSGCISSSREWGVGSGSEASSELLIRFYYSPHPTPHIPSQSGSPVSKSTFHVPSGCFSQTVMYVPSRVLPLKTE